MHFGRELGEYYGIGQIFLSTDPERCRGRRATEQALSDQGLQVLGWRVVPTDSSCVAKLPWLACRY